MSETTKSGIQEAVDVLGTQEAMAERLGVTQQAVQQWVARGWAPLLRVKDVAALTGVERSRLCDPKVAELFE